MGIREEVAGGGDGDGDGRRLVRCCEEDRPCAPAPVVIRASAGKGHGDSVTIHDYVVAVHALLQPHREALVEHLRYVHPELDKQMEHDPSGGARIIGEEIWVSPWSRNGIRIEHGRPGDVSPVSSF